VFSQRVVYEGRPALFVLAMDLSERRRLERQLTHSREQLRRILARARALREHDRTRIARELHDQLGQTLAAIKIELSWLADSVAGREPGLMSEKIASMVALVDETIGRVRRISSELRPAVLDRLGLCAAIEWLAQDFERRTGIPVRFTSRVDDVELDRGRSTGVFRVLQEAFTMSRGARGRQKCFLACGAATAGSPSPCATTASASRPARLKATDRSGSSECVSASKGWAACSRSRRAGVRAPW